MMPKDPYTIAYAIGYYYGRAHGSDVSDAVPLMAVEDLYHRDTVGFNDGLQAGRRDYINMDLTAAAMACDPVDLL